MIDRKRALSQLSDQDRKFWDHLWLHIAREMGINVLDMSASEAADAMKKLHAEGFLTLVMEEEGIRVLPTLPKETRSGDL
jgi:hypothetical protein